MSQATVQGQPSYRSWLLGSLVFLALLTIVRLALEIAGVPQTVTRYFSSTAAIFLVALYLGAVAPLRGIGRFVQLILPAIVVTLWSVGWVIIVTALSALLRLERSHFAEKEDYGDLAHLGRHIFGHLEETPVIALLVVIFMALPYWLCRWPVTVGPAALLGALVIIRYWAEAMDVAPASAAAWSSTVGVLLCGFYLGGVGPRLGLTSAGQLFVPGVIIGWVWRFWVFLAAVMSATVPFYKTHFFDPSRGRVTVRLSGVLGGGIVEGFLAGLVLWGIAAWILRATRQPVEGRSP